MRLRRAPTARAHLFEHTHRFSRVVSINVFRTYFVLLLNPRGRANTAKRWSSRVVDQVHATHDTLAELKDGTSFFDVATLKGRERLVKVLIMTQDRPTR